MEPKSKFHITFGQAHPLRHGWVELEASTAEHAKEIVEYVFGMHYSNMYDTTLFDVGLFPAGRFGEILIGK